MSPTEAAALLAIAAAFDNRKPDADAATAWALALDGLRFQDCQEAIVAHYRESSDWLMPNRVVTKVRKIRSQRIHSFGTLPDPPAELESPREVIAWHRDQCRRIADGDLTRETYAEPTLPRRSLGDLESLTRRIPEGHA